MSALWAVLWKDLITEWRSRDRVTAMAVFALLVVVIFHFALPEATTREAVSNTPGLLWVAYVFASLLGLNRSLALELENDALSGLALAPVDRGWIFLGKALANFVLIGIVQLITAFAFALVFRVDLLSIAPQLAGLTALATLGICCVGTLLSAMAVRTRFGEVLLPILMLPTVIPILVGAVEGTASLLSAGALTFASVQLLLVVDAIYLITSFLVFEYVLDE